MKRWGLRMSQRASGLLFSGDVAFRVSTWFNPLLDMFICLTHVWSTFWPVEPWLFLRSRHLLGCIDQAWWTVFLMVAGTTNWPPATRLGLLRGVTSKPRQRVLVSQPRQPREIWQMRHQRTGVRNGCSRIPQNPVGWWTWWNVRSLDDWVGHVPFYIPCISMYVLCFLTIFKCWYLWAQDEARAKESGRVLTPAAVEVAVFGARCRAPRAMKNEGPVSGSFVFKTCCWGAVHNFRSARNTRQKVQKRFKNGYCKKKRPLWYSQIRLKSVRGNISILNNSGSNRLHGFSTELTRQSIK